MSLSIHICLCGFDVGVESLLGILHLNTCDFAWSIGTLPLFWWMVKVMRIFDKEKTLNSVQESHVENSQFHLCLTDIRTMHGVKEWYRSPDVLNPSLMFFARFHLFADKKNNGHFTSTKILQTNFRRTQSQKSHPHFVDCFTVPL